MSNKRLANLKIKRTFLVRHAMEKRYFKSCASVFDTSFWASLILKVHFLFAIFRRKYITSGTIILYTIAIDAKMHEHEYATQIWYNTHTSSTLTNHVYDTFHILFLYIFEFFYVGWILLEHSDNCSTCHLPYCILKV